MHGMRLLLRVPASSVYEEEDPLLAPPFIRSGSYVCMMYGVFANWSTRNETLEQDFLVGLVTQRRIFASAKSERDRLPGIMHSYKTRPLINVNVRLFSELLLTLSSSFHAYFSFSITNGCFHADERLRLDGVAFGTRIIDSLCSPSYTFNNIVHSIEIFLHKKTIQLYIW